MGRRQVVEANPGVVRSWRYGTITPGPAWYEESDKCMR